MNCQTLATGRQCEPARATDVFAGYPEMIQHAATLEYKPRRRPGQWRLELDRPTILFPCQGGTYRRDAKRTEMRRGTEVNSPPPSRGKGFLPPLILSLSKDTPILSCPRCGVGAGFKPAPTVAYRHPHPNLPPSRGKGFLPPLILSLSKDAGTTAVGRVRGSRLCGKDGSFPKADMR